MRFAFLLAPLPLLIAGACSLESGGLAGDAGADSPGLEDRGSGMTDSGGTCACVPNPGAGWTFIAYERDGADPCVGDFGTQRFAVEETATGPALCACTCGMSSLTDATCVVTGTVSIDFYKGTSVCAGGPDKSFSGSAPCLNTNPDYNQNGQTISAKGPAPTIQVQGGTCATPTVNTTNVPTDLHKGQSCTLTGGLGTGCMNASDSCVPTTPMGFTLCVAINQADAACPPKFATKHRVGVGKSDSRACTACSCQPDPICVVNAQFNSKDDCTGNSEGSSFALDGMCHSVTNGTNIAGHGISTGITATQRCSAAGGMATGAVSLDSEYTICCP